ncbi:TPA: protein rep, partial [Burkholderia vietnamiensis]|nr:protein rep [Burkholderia vietnamiensis]
MIVEINIPNAGPAMQSACESTDTTLHSQPAEVKSELLVERSPGDKPWDENRASADRVTAIYADAEPAKFQRLADRMVECSGWLTFGDVVDRETGELRLRLKNARFCRVRHCPVCQWRRSLMWKAKFYEALPAIVANHPGGRWIMLTLTVRNCPVEDLRETLASMNKAWHRFVKRKEFADVLGWVRTTEVTRGADGSAHPHFHILAQVKSTFFKPGHYVKHEGWRAAWRDAARLAYDPMVEVHAVRDAKGKTVSNANVETMRGAVAEVLKYAVKPADMEADAAWF